MSLLDGASHTYTNSSITINISTSIACYAYYIIWINSSDLKINDTNISANATSNSSSTGGIGVIY